MPPLVPPLIALLAGILASPYLDLTYVWITFPVTVLIAIARVRYALLAVVLLGVLLASRQEIRPQAIPDDGYAVRVVATVDGAPKYRAPGYYLNVHILSVGEVEWWGRARLSYFPAEEDLERLFRQLDLGSGDRIEVLVRLRPPNSYRNPGAFDYRSYLERQGIYWTGSIRNPRLIQVLDRGWHGGDQLRERVTERVASHFEDGSTNQALVLGMVLGQQRRLSAEDARKFRSAGLIHLLVVSGFNLALVAALALWLGRRIPLGRYQRMGSLIFALVVIWSYALLVEGASPVIRATLMASLLVAGTLLDRGYAIWNALAATAIVILIIAPPTLADSSFQFTFLAVLGILLLSVPLIRWTLVYGSDTANWMTADLSRSRSTSVRLAERSRIVLLAAEGGTIMRSPPAWRSRARKRAAGAIVLWNRAWLGSKRMRREADGFPRSVAGSEPGSSRRHWKRSPRTRRTGVGPRWRRPLA